MATDMKFCQIRWSPKLHQKVKIEAARHGVTINEFVTRAVEDWMAAERAAKKNGNGR